MLMQSSWSGGLRKKTNPKQWGHALYVIIIQSSMEAILACHPGLSTDWLAGWQVPVYHDIWASVPFRIRFPMPVWYVVQIFRSQLSFHNKTVTLQKLATGIIWWLRHRQGKFAVQKKNHLQQIFFLSLSCIIAGGAKIGWNHFILRSVSWLSHRDAAENSSSFFKSLMSLKALMSCWLNCRFVRYCSAWVGWRRKPSGHRFQLRLHFSILTASYRRHLVREWNESNQNVSDCCHGHVWHWPCLPGAGGGQAETVVHHESR